jgi:hypothetical protein
MRGVCLLLWLKANPRTKVPLKAGEKEDNWESSLWQACVHGHVEIVKKIGPNSEDDLDGLLRLACIGHNADLIEYLIGLGANPNTVPANGETAVRSALWGLEWRFDFDRHERYGHRYEKALDTLKRLVQLGGRLNAENGEELRFLRRCLLKLDRSESCDLIKFLHVHNFTERAVLLRLLKEPKLRQHLDRGLKLLARTFPEVKKWAGRSTSVGLTRR